MVQRVTTNDNDWQRITTNSTTSDNEWYNEWQRMTTSDNEWSFWLIFLFLREEPALCTLKILLKHWQRTWRLFQDSFIFGETTSSLFFKYFDTAVTLLKQLFLQSSCFLGALFSKDSFSCSSYFFQNTYFLEQNLYWAATSWE